VAKSTKAPASKKDLIRLQAEADFLFFIRLIHPNRVLGLVHEDLARWLTREDRKSHQLVLMPRDHQKSAVAGYYAAWEITRNPAIRILYISSTSNLAIKQLKFIKDILTSDIYRFYWPEMVNPDLGCGLASSRARLEGGRSKVEPSNFLHLTLTIQRYRYGI
jgi:hypothetical protein